MEYGANFLLPRGPHSWISPCRCGRCKGGRGGRILLWGASQYAQPPASLQRNALWPSMLRKGGGVSHFFLAWKAGQNTTLDNELLTPTGLTKNQPEVFLHKVFLRPPGVMDVRAFGSRTSAQKT